ncbi:MAG: outer membrane protein assembly factor BamA [Myxococcota bacterium]|nr:outer membrane protein assembly factor BamA [Myxococcota bacterium]
MTRILQYGLTLLMCLSATLALGQNTSSGVIDEIKVEGNRRSEADAIIGIIQTRVGRSLDTRQVSDDIKSIFALGFYRDVQVDLDVSQGKNIVTFKVLEKPSIKTIEYEGNDELTEDDIAEVVDLKAFGVLDLAKVTRNADKIKELYIEKGYFLATVKWKIIDLPNNEVNVVFVINEQDEVNIARVSIVGNQVLSEQFIKSRIESREYSLLGSMSGAGTYSKQAFERDLLRIGQMYYNEGYVKAQVGQGQVELSPDRRQIFITITVDEGPRFKVGALDMTGDFLKPKDELMALIKLESGDWFSSGKLRDTINAVGEVYKNEGYAYVNVVPNTLVNDEKKEVAVTIDIDKGNKVRFGRIQIVGNNKTRDKVIRRELRIYEGEYYSATGMKRSERNINRLGFFEPGSVTLRTTRGSTDDTMDVTIQVKERSTGTFQIGAGFSTLENFMAQAQISQNNLFGRGQSLSFQATLSSIRSMANLRFADNYLFDSKVRFAANIYRLQTSLQTFVRTKIGGNLTLGYPLNDDWSVSTTYTLEEVGIESGGFGTQTLAGPIKGLYGNGITSSLRLGVAYDTRNNRLFPSAGIFATTSVEQAAEFLLSDNLFTRYRARGRFYQSLGLGVVAKLNTEWGLITSPSQAGVTLAERFFVGGPLSVRGFRRLSLGPTMDVISGDIPDGTTFPISIGGTEQLIFNLELEYPIFQKVGIRGVFFLDSGNAYDASDEWNDKLADLRYAWGFGIRWFSPIGPLRFEWGFPFEPRVGEESSVFDFSIGNFF